jgi:hypothetical protein
MSGSGADSSSRLMGFCPRTIARDEGRLLALRDHFVHDTGAYTPRGLVVPLLSASMLAGRTGSRTSRCASTASIPIGTIGEICGGEILN